jgi:hypothetical protein
LVVAHFQREQSRFTLSFFATFPGKMSVTFGAYEYISISDERKHKYAVLPGFFCPSLPLAQVQDLRVQEFLRHALVRSLYLLFPKTIEHWLGVYIHKWCHTSGSGWT